MYMWSAVIKKKKLPNTNSSKKKYYIDSTNILQSVSYHCNRMAWDDWTSAIRSIWKGRLKLKTILVQEYSN